MSLQKAGRFVPVALAAFVTQMLIPSKAWKMSGNGGHPLTVSATLDGAAAVSH